MRLALLAMMAMLTACSGPVLRDELEPEPATFAAPPAAEGLIYTAASQQRSAGANRSGFLLLDDSESALMWRLALIDSAVSSVDIQTYLWYGDHSGRLLMDRVIRAAERGVRVRLLVDDLLTIGFDQALYELQVHPNIQFRLFNPWTKRGLAQRAGQMALEMERLNTRMHDKLMIVDGHAVIIGGRNLGDHYFGLSHAYNFHDLDVLGLGAIAGQANAMFDHFWNSEWVVSAANIDLEHDAKSARDGLEKLRDRIEESEELYRFPKQPRDWSNEFADLAPRLHSGTSRVVYDETTQNEIVQNVAAELFGVMGLAQEELLITNAYIIPGQRAIDGFQMLADRGVTVRVLTNSLASHDVPAVNSHYKGWRDDLVNAGVALYELRADPEIQEKIVDVPPVSGEFVGLHSKAFVIDRNHSFIGSMNFDPRSVNINTEGGVFIESPGLAHELAAVMERDMQPENAWQVHLDDKGRPYWTNANERVTRQPARGFGQRILDAFFRLFPKDLY